ncbi:hypothetical protein [Liquorilactobacillus mali]|uniref:Uncharacterized protein n=1 Tax=Liquorilactobacillus mali TaxID=1618 RepID=A0A0R2FS39_9LACO|nr:hypothetical protein [Liquorilactobacillus mali]KRN31136.1 hypothetical protein IV36_GL001945 [Liquorilactobacillus mali]
MKLSIEGTPEEIKNVLQAISGSKEHGIFQKVTEKEYEKPKDKDIDALFDVSDVQKSHQQLVTSLNDLKELANNTLDDDVLRVSIKKKLID